MATLAFEGITRRFGSVVALRRTNLTVPEGEFLTLLGPSGSGKTTLLNICAGFLEPTTGTLRHGGVDITQFPTRRRGIGMVFQNYALFPHMSVFENVAYGLRCRGVGASELATRVSEALQMVRLNGLDGRPIHQLSGGQQQRVALARAMVIEPGLLLMDEPLGALDRQLRKEVQLEIRRLHLSRPRTTLYVTHDQEEALVMSDRIAVMRAGSIVQLGSARELYERPANAFVARFLGESNLLSGQVTNVNGAYASLTVRGLAEPIWGRAGPGISTGAGAVALIRPESVHARPGGLKAQVLERVYLGEIASLRVYIAPDLELWWRGLSASLPMEVNEVEIGWAGDAVSILADAQDPGSTEP